MNKRGRGRPTVPTTARDDILAVARRRFLADGYAAVTMRSVARQANVDPALISYHFGSKSGLFSASLGLSTNPPQILAGALHGPRETLAERILTALLATWGDPVHGPALRMLSEAALRDDEVARLFRELVAREIIGRLADHLHGPGAQARAAAAATQLAGLILLRFLIRAEPLASASPDELVALLAPPLRATLGPRRPVWPHAD